MDRVETLGNRGDHTHIIWDFNGTLLDDIRLGIDSVNTMLEKRGLPVIPDEETYRHVFGFPVDIYYRRLGFDFEAEDYDTVLAPEWVAHYLAGEAGCGLIPGAAEVVAAIGKKGLPQLVLSATKIEQLEGQIRRLGLEDAFEEILGLDNIHARSKVNLALDWKERHPHACPLFIGDTEHDVDVADAIGADCILFCGGHQAEEILRGKGKPVIARMEDVLLYL